MVSCRLNPEFDAFSVNVVFGSERSDFRKVSCRMRDAVLLCTLSREELSLALVLKYFLVIVNQLAVCQAAKCVCVCV